MNSIDDLFCRVKLKKKAANRKITSRLVPILISFLDYDCTVFEAGGILPNIAWRSKISCVKDSDIRCA